MNKEMKNIIFFPEEDLDSNKTNNSSQFLNQSEETQSNDSVSSTRLAEGLTELEDSEVETIAPRRIH